MLLASWVTLNFDVSIIVGEVIAASLKPSTPPVVEIKVAPFGIWKDSAFIWRTNNNYRIVPAYAAHNIDQNRCATNVSLISFGLTVYAHDTTLKPMYVEAVKP